MKPLLIRSAFHFLLKYTGNTVAIRIGVELGGIDARAVRRDQRILLRLALQPEADIGDAVVLNETAVIELPVLVRTAASRRTASAFQQVSMRYSFCGEPQRPL